MISKRLKNILIGIISLASGGSLYICFRESSYISRLADTFFSLESIRAVLRPCRSDFLLYQLPDLLWGLSLGCLLTAVNPHTGRAVRCAAAAALCGCVWEFLQLLHIVNGTADPLDVFMYLTAGLITIIINLKEKRK